MSIRLALFAVLVSTTLTVAAQQPAPPEAAATQEQVHALDKDLSVLKETASLRIDAQDKRIGDLAGQQANYLAAISAQTGSVANYIAITGVAITVLFFIAGLATYFSATNKAVKEANDAAAAWFANNGAEQTAKLNALREQYDVSLDEFKRLRDASADALQEMRAQIEIVKETAEKARKDIVTARDQVDSYSRQILNSADTTIGGSSTPTDATAVSAVREASQELKTKPESDFTADDYWTRGLADYSLGHFESALTAFRNGAAQAEKNADAKKVHEQLRLAIGVTLGQMGRSEEAIALYDDIVRSLDGDNEETSREQLAIALVNKAHQLASLNRLDDAVAVYDDVARRFENDPAPTLRVQVAKALLGKGYQLGALKRPLEEIAVYDDVVQRYAADPSPELRVQVAIALYNKGYSLKDLGRSDEAIAAYSEVVRLFGDDPYGPLRERVARALVNKGHLLGELSRNEEAMTVYDDVLQRFDGDAAPKVREQVAMALCNKGNRLSYQGRSDDAIATYDEVVQRFGADLDPTMPPLVARASNQSGYQYLFKAKREWADPELRRARLETAITAFRGALKTIASEFRSVVLANLGYALYLHGDLEEARESTRQALELAGEPMLGSQRADTATSRVEPEDTRYEAMLDEIWLELNPSHEA
jgi:tetratricopeptide (TPR) repeat protein